MNGGIIGSNARNAESDTAPRRRNDPARRPEAPGRAMDIRRVAPDLTHEEIQRYSRHLVMPEVGLDGQQRLKAARVLVVGMGGLGSPASMYLAAAGVGTIGLVDFDDVEFSNLQRQILHGTSDVGRPKLVSAYARLSALNPEVRLVPHDARLSSANALEIVRAYDIVVDGTDNFATRYLVNDACVLTGRPNVYGSIFRFEGQASVFAARGGPCYRCLHPEPPPPGLVPNCAEGGVLGVLPGVIGTIQATEAIKLIAGIGEPLVGRFLIYDALRMRFRELALRRDPECPVCGDRPSIRELQDYERVCGDAAPAQPAGTMQDVDMSVLELKARLDRGDAPFLLDVREPRELAISRIEGATLIPLGDLPRRLAELPADRDIVVICRTGARSARAVGFLRERGLHRARNLRGGMREWADKVDPTMVKY
jgi:adenylyltransferase/sulfurtransferase